MDWQRLIPGREALLANLPAAAASTLFSDPLTFAPLYYTAYHLGAWVTGETAIPSENAETRGMPEKNKTVLQRIKALGKPLLVIGGLVDEIVIGLERLRKEGNDLVCRHPRQRNEPTSDKRNTWGSADGQRAPSLGCLTFGSDEVFPLLCKSRVSGGLRALSRCDT